MADYEIRHRANIGSSSLILIFIVLCLAAFSVLSLGNARREDSFSVRNAEAVQGYYRADAEGAAFAQKIDFWMQKLYSEQTLPTGKTQAAEVFADCYDAQQNCFYRNIPMQSGMALHVELVPDWERGTLRVQEWTVYEKELLEIDQSMPVWTGTGEE